MTASLIVGASAGLGRELAEGLAACGHDLFLLSSDVADLEPLARDLRLRHGVEIAYAGHDLGNLDADALAVEVLAGMPALDNLLLVAGYGSDADYGHVEDGLAAKLATVNFVAGLRIVNSLFDHFAARPNGNIIGIGSAGAMRGRSANMIYAAAKRGLEFYFEALRHRLAATGCRVQFYRLGFMRTAMLGRYAGRIPAAEPKDVAAAIIANLGQDTGCRYLPGWWLLIDAILTRLPWFLFRRMFAKGALAKD